MSELTLDISIIGNDLRGKESKTVVNISEVWSIRRKEIVKDGIDLSHGIFPKYYHNYLSISIGSPNKPESLSLSLSEALEIVNPFDPPRGQCSVTATWH